ncbi:hematopoietic SH2 domain-containing protein [Gastrophryne carolinensis]
MEQSKPSVKWFVETQSEWFIQNGIPEWFHGVITRRDAEDLLKDRTPGCFLIRVSESRIGYSLSYRTKDRYRHFMIDVLEDQQFCIVGDTAVHKTLDDLVKFHTKSPLYPYNEILTQPCGQKTHSATDYEELFEDRDIFATPFQTSGPSSIGDSATIGATMHPVISHISVFPSQQAALVKSNSVESYFPSAAHPTNCDHVYEQTPDQAPAKPMKTARNAMSRAVSLMTDGDIAQDLKKMENAMTAHMKTVKTSLGRIGQPIQKKSPPALPRNRKHTHMQEEYKKPPPFAPGFC